METREIDRLKGKNNKGKSMKKKVFKTFPFFLLLLLPYFVHFITLGSSFVVEKKKNVRYI